MGELVSGEGSIEKILDRDGVYASVTSGTSMSPLFKTHRDMVILKKVDAPLKKYDVALYRVGGKYILHRVIAVDNERGIYVIRGDNTYMKEYIPQNNVLAVLTAFNRRGKRHDVTDAGYKIYSVLWNFIYPVRYAARKILSIAARLFRKIFKKKSEGA